jgi:pimeloyl-ACP methyl ester carboxylesterase
LVDALIRRFYGCVVSAALCTAAFDVPARAVTVPHAGQTLGAELELARGRVLADGVILMVHGTMAHRDMDAMRHLRRLLQDKGHSTLSINLSLGRDRREGMFDCAWPNTHRAEDALAEIGVWLDWLRREGARRVTLLGFSRGGQQAAWFAAQGPRAGLDTVVLLAPILAGDLAGRYAARFGTPIEPLLARARALQSAGNGAALLRGVGFLNCEQADVSADAFLSYYAPRPDSELSATLPRIAAPVLVVVAGGDEIVRDLDQRIAPLADGKRVRMTVIPGSDHFFRDLYGEDAVDAVDGFLREH